MYRFLETFFLVATLVGTEAWLLQGYFAGKPGWEPAFAFLAALSAILLRDPAKTLFKKSSFQNDQDLFSKFLKDFPSNGASAKFLKEQDIGAPFRSSELEQIDAFANSWNNAEHKFQLRALERKRKSLLVAVEEFRRKLAVNMFPDNTSGFLTMDLKDLEDRPERLAKREELNKLASNVYEIHQGFITTANKVLRREV